jgi:predicted nucleotidyltransferase component of viral defense system
VIPISYIQDWSKSANWPNLDQVEQDLIISRAIIDIFNNEFLRQNLMFRGGTALNKLYFKPAARYSEDIDLVQINRGPVGNILDHIQKSLSWLGKPVKKKFSEGLVTLKYKFETESRGFRSKIKVEINTRENFILSKSDIKMDFEMINPWYTGVANICCYELEELLATKLRALYQRRKGRDLFDLYFATNVAKESFVKILCDLYR